MEIDFITAFGRLLRDGKLRDAFAVDPRTVAEEIRLSRLAWPAWFQLVPDDLELQATVLLRKRLDLVKKFAPETCRQTGERLWPLFQRYARLCWPPEGGAKISDAFQFCQHLRRFAPETVANSEWNRLHFALSTKRVAFYIVRIPAVEGRGYQGLQVLLRGRQQHWREIHLRFKL
jgi:hypothetical protein